MYVCVHACMCVGVLVLFSAFSSISDLVGSPLQREHLSIIEADFQGRMLDFLSLQIPNFYV